MANTEEGGLTKMCPFLEKWCIKGACALWIEVIHQQVVLGVKRQVKGGACCLPSLAMIMSNRPAPGQNLNLPKLKGLN